jgi:hypothetical protein
MQERHARALIEVKQIAASGRIDAVIQINAAIAQILFS